MAKDVAGSYASQRELDLILNGDYQHVFRKQEYFTLDSSTGHVFDVVSGMGMMKCDVPGEELAEIVKHNQPGSYDTRVIFVDCVQKDEEKLSLTSAHLRSVFDTFGISPRFARFICRQHMPGSATRFDETMYKPHQHEFWHSAVIRSKGRYGDETARDLCRKVVGWRRFSLWSKYDLSTKRLHVLLLGCPPAMRENFKSVFEGEAGRQLQRHPMILHAFFARDLVLRTYDFLQEVSDPLYEQEFKAQQLKSAIDYTERVQVFLAFSRQIKQISTDYDILDATLEHLKREHQWFEENLHSTAISEITTGASMQDERELRALLLETFDSFLRDAKLIRTYSNLFNERSKLGVSEGFAMVNQRDAEVNLRMATESTQIARASHQDSRALRVIQILSMLFLPASLVSSIFGMGFFSTSQGNDGQAVLLISKSWWLYIAISFPLTALCLIFMGFYNVAFKGRARGRPPLDMEKALSSDLKAD